ncbi:hypothetical protein [Georgenia sunbinii]|uniref:hypothetical protein n=1 Tax=Georgenia sunbinii TaxID=3117728 RepID=UPI002F267A9C
MAGPIRDSDGDESSHDDFEARWAELTERLGELRLPPEADVPPGPPPAEQAPRGPAPVGPRDFSPAPESEDDDPDRDVVDGFVAPEPEPLRDAQPIVVVGWLAVLAGLAAMMLCVLAWRTAPGLVWLTAAGSLAVGIGILLWRLPSHREPDDYDDGAVV